LINVLLCEGALQILVLVVVVACIDFKGVKFIGLGKTVSEKNIWTISWYMVWGRNERCHMVVYTFPEKA
jgi:hypothetical protein